MTVLLSPSFGRPVASSAEGNSMLTRIRRGTANALSNLSWGLDSLGALSRSAIDYAQDGEWNNPYDPDKRVTGEQILDNAGWRDDSTGRWFAGLALEVATDPLTYLTGGITKAGKALKAAGVLPKAAAAASRSLQDDVVRTAVGRLGSNPSLLTSPPRTSAQFFNALTDTAPELAGRPQRTLKAMGSNIADYIEHDTRPLVGQRVAQRSQTLESVMDSLKATDPALHAKAEQGVQAFLKKKGWGYNAIKGQRLGGGLGVVGTTISFDPLGETAGKAISAGLDRIGEAARWSRAGVLANSLATKAVAGQTDAAAQAAASRISAAAEAGEGVGRRKSAELALDLRNATIDPAVASRTGITDIFSPQAGEAIDRVIEGVAATANDLDFVNSTPGVRAFVDTLKTDFADILAKSRANGVRSHALQHFFGAGYRPYQLESLLEQAKGGKKNQPLWDLVTGDMQKRRKALQLPGGLDQLRALSTDPRFVGLGDSFSEDYITEVLHREINNFPGAAYYQTPSGQVAAQRQLQLMAQAQAMPPGARTKLPKRVHGPVIPPQYLGAGQFKDGPYTKARARQLANFLHGLEVAKDASGNITSPPVFGNHPLEAAARYLSGREKAIATAPSIVDTIASQLVEMPKSQVPGGNHVSAATALVRAGLISPKTGTGVREGGQQMLRERLAAKLTKLGRTTKPDQVDLAAWSIPAEKIESLTRMHDFYQSPKAVAGLGAVLAQYNKIFKANVLSWASRLTRDNLSGFVSNVIEAGPQGALEGAIHARHILGGDYKKALPLIKQMPMYQNMPDDEAIRRFLLDSADAQVLRGTGVIDRMPGDRTAAVVQQILPGAKRQTISEGLKAGLKPGRSWSGFAYDALNPFGVNGVAGRKETTNPIYKTAEALGDYSDNFNRLTGYMALLKRGLSPQEASRRMLAAHVDYGSLSTAERRLRDSWMPFYAYNSRIGKYAASKIAEHPGGPFGQMVRAVDKAQSSDDDQNVPNSVRQQTGFLIPKEVGETLESWGLPNIAESEDGRRGYIKNIDLPAVAFINQFAMPKDMDGTLDVDAALVNTAQSFGSQLAPQWKAAIELLSGRDMFRHRPLGEAPTTMDTLIGRAVGNDDFRLPNTVNAALAVASPMIPLLGTRNQTALRQATDDRIEGTAPRLGSAVFNAVSPFRYGTFDQEEQARDQMRAVSAELAKVPQAKTIEMTTISKEDFATLTPEQQQLYLLRNELQKEQRKRAEAKKRAERFAGG
jgi:hypothetical protein